MLQGCCIHINLYLYIYLYLSLSLSAKVLDSEMKPQPVSQIHSCLAPSLQVSSAITDRVNSMGWWFRVWLLSLCLHGFSSLGLEFRICRLGVSATGFWSWPSQV